MNREQLIANLMNSNPNLGYDEASRQVDLMYGNNPLNILSSQYPNNIGTTPDYSYMSIYSGQQGAGQANSQTNQQTTPTTFNANNGTIDRTVDIGTMTPLNVQQIPTSSQNIVNAPLPSNVSDEDRIRYETTMQSITGTPQNESNNYWNSVYSQNQNNRINTQYFNPLWYGGGTSAESEAYRLGQAIGSPVGTRGRGLTIGASGVALGLGIGRNLLSGVANQRQTANNYEWYLDQMSRVNYTPNGQYQNQNNRSGISVNKIGGVFKIKRNG